MKWTTALFVKMCDDEEELPAIVEGKEECIAILTGQNTACFSHEPTGWTVKLGFTLHSNREQTLAEKFEGVWPGSFWLSIDGRRFDQLPDVPQQEETEDSEDDQDSRRGMAGMSVCVDMLD